MAAAVLTTLGANCPPSDLVAIKVVDPCVVVLLCSPGQELVVCLHVCIIQSFYTGVASEDFLFQFFQVVCVTVVPVGVGLIYTSNTACQELASSAQCANLFAVDDVDQVASINIAKGEFELNSHYLLLWYLPVLGSLVQLALRLIDTFIVRSLLCSIHYILKC